MKKNTNMKSVSKFALLLIALLVMSEGLEIVHAQRQIFITDFGDIAYVDSTKTNVFALDVNQSVETEPNGGGWISGKEYQVNWTIRLDYANPDILKGNTFCIVVSLPSLSKDPNVVILASTNKTQVSLAQKNATLSAIFKPGNVSEGFFCNVDLPFVIYIYRTIYDSGVFYQRCNFATTIANRQNSVEIITAPEFPSIAIILALIAAVALSIVIRAELNKRSVTSWKCDTKYIG